MEGQPITDLIEANLCDRCSNCVEVKCAIPDARNEIIEEIRTFKSCRFMTKPIMEDEVSGVIECGHYIPKAE